MMPTNETGPASDTAAPVASDALTSATRSVRSTLTPRAAADSLPTLMRSSTRGSVANPAHAIAIGTSAATIGEKDATSSDPISQRTLRNVSVKSARYCTKAMTADSSSVQRHAAEQQHDRGRSAPSGRRQAVDDRQRADRPGEARQRHGRDAEQREIEVEGDRHHRAERRARGDAQRVGRRQRVPQQRLEHDAGERERAADERRGQHARQPRDEENLRVDVVGVRDRPVEHRGQADARAADERREEAGAGGAARRNRPASTSAGVESACAAGIRRSPQLVRAMGTTVR